jgi:hydroxyacylglutathione hydrolase
MKRDNRAGPPVLGSLPTPPRLDAAALGTLAHRRDAAVIDTRGRAAFFERHLPGAILVDLDYRFCTIAGSYVHEQAPIYLIVEEDRLDEAVRALIRIGLDRVVGYVPPAALDEYARAGGALAPTETIDMRELEARRLAGAVRVLDVRSQSEYDALHVPDAIRIPHTQLLERLHELPTDRPLAVHCQTGSRSAAAVSLLERHGYRAVDVDDLISNYRQGGPQVENRRLTRQHVPPEPDGHEADQQTE